MENITEFAQTVGSHHQWLKLRSASLGIFWFSQILLLALGCATLLGALAALLAAFYLQTSWGPYALLAEIRMQDSVLAQALDLLQEHHRLQLLFRLGQALSTAKALLTAFAAMQGLVGITLLALCYARARHRETLENCQDFATQVGVRLARLTENPRN